MDQWAAITFASTGILAAILLGARVWVQRNRGTFDPNRELQTVVGVVVVLVAVAFLSAWRLGAIVGLPTFLAAMGFALYWFSARQPESRPGWIPRVTLRRIALLAVLSGVGGVILGLTRLAVGH